MFLISSSCKSTNQYRVTRLCIYSRVSWNQPSQWKQCNRWRLNKLIVVQRPTVLSTVTIRAQRKYCACETLIGENYTGQQIFLEAKKKPTAGSHMANNSQICYSYSTSEKISTICDSFYWWRLDQTNRYFAEKKTERKTGQLPFNLCCNTKPKIAARLL